MNNLTKIVCLLLFTCLISSMPATFARGDDHAGVPEGFTSLFNGENLDGWTGGETKSPREIAAMSDEAREAYLSKMLADASKHWSVENGELVSDGHGPHLVTEEDFGDFEFWIDWKLSKNGDSGVYLRGYPQVQIWDPTNVKAHQHGSDKGSGGLWNNQKYERFPSEVADKPIGQWNRLYIRMVGSFVTVKLNGKTVVDNVLMENYFNRQLPVLMAGPLHLQTHGSETRFRNIFVRELSAEESNQALTEIYGTEGFETAFNGEDLSGWTGATDQYEIVDGAIRCKPGSGGNLVTEQRFGNFIAHLQFKLPPAGNNGLAIRVPNANVNPADAGVELQILDDTAEKYAKLRDYQYHGSAYGLAPATRGYLRPVGQWNFQRVMLVGSNAQVHLNGFKILDVDLAELAKNRGDAKPHAGALRTEGHFGFCGHHDPVEFRAIRIKKLD